MNIKHFKSVEDFTREEYLEIFEYAEKLSTGEDFSNLCRGKILSAMFFSESTRTANVFKTAMLRLGGGVIGIEGTSGTYLATGEEDKGDTLREFGLLSDLMVTRDSDEKTLDIATSVTNIPVINGGSGIQEHASSIFWLGYEIFSRFKKIDGLKIAIYGAPGPSRIIKSMIKWLVKFDVEIYVDVVMSELDLPQDLYDYVKNSGKEIHKVKLDDILSEVDVLMVEAIPVKFIEQELVERYISVYEPISSKHISKMKKDSAFVAVPPRIIKGDLLSTLKEVDDDSRSMNKTGSKKWSYGIMGLIVKLLNLEIK